MHSPQVVLLIGNFASRWGSNASASEALAARLAAECTVLSTSAKKHRLTRLVDMLSAVWLERHRYDVAQVAVFSGNAFVWAETVCALLRLLGKKHVVTLHGGNLPMFAARWPNRLRRLLNGAIAVTAPSEYLIAELSHLRPNIIHLPNAIPLNEYRFRRRVPLSPKLLWMRAFHRIYNPEMAIRVLALLSDVPDITLTMAGPILDDSFSYARDEAKRLNVLERVRFIGHVRRTAIPDVLDHHDILLNTTRIDNAPVSVVEALASGLCVVTTRVGGIPFLLEDRVTALFVENDDARHMAGGVRELLTDADLAERLSREGLAIARRHSWDNVLPRWRELLGLQHAPLIRADA